MHNAAVSGIRCAREYGAITQGKVGGTADRGVVQVASVRL